MTTTLFNITMKKLLLGVLTLLLLGLAGCQSPIETAIGTYSYHASGDITLGGERYLITDEKGEMDMIYLQDNTLLMTFSAENGGAYTTQATISQQDIFITPFNRSMEVKYTVRENSLLGGPKNIEKTESYSVDVYGEGHIYGETIILDLKYDGKGLADQKHLIGKKITLIAKKVE